MKSVGYRLALVITLSVITLLLAPCIGMETIVPLSINNSPMQMEIFMQLRLPRVLIAFCAGAGLSLAGVVFQAMFRNPLADPFTLGIASGASCGAAFTVIMGLCGTIIGVSTVTLGAFAGSIVATLLLFGFTAWRRTTDKLTMLLAGVALSFLFSSLLMFFQYLSNVHDSFFIVRWLMGGVETVGYGSLLSLILFEFMGIAIIFVSLPNLDHLLTGDDIAKSRGVDITSVRISLLIATTLLIGSIVAVCGPIGFVGLIVPHFSRSLFSYRHTVAAPVSMVAGGTLLVWADTIARTIVAPTEIPVGVITALIGTPVFIWFLIHGNGKGNIHEL